MLKSQNGLSQNFMNRASGLTGAALLALLAATTFPEKASAGNRAPSADRNADQFELQNRYDGVISTSPCCTKKDARVFDTFETNYDENGEIDPDVPHRVFVTETVEGLPLIDSETGERGIWIDIIDRGRTDGGGAGASSNRYGSFRIVSPEETERKCQSWRKKEELQGIPVEESTCVQPTESIAFMFDNIRWDDDNGRYYSTTNPNITYTYDEATGDFAKTEDGVTTRVDGVDSDDWDITSYYCFIPGQEFF